MEKLSEEQMWEVIDGLATPDILEKHQTLMLTDPAYKAEFEQYTFLDLHLQKLDLEIPSMRFTENVIDTVLDIKKQEVKKDWTPTIYLGVMLILSMILIFALVPSAKPADDSIPVNPDSVMSFLGNPYLINLFIIVNVLLVYVLLDKKLLKPFFDKKMK